MQIMNELLDYVRSAMQVVKGARLIAWDIAVTPRWIRHD